MAVTMPVTVKCRTAWYDIFYSDLLPSPLLPHTGRSCLPALRGPVTKGKWIRSETGGVAGAGSAPGSVLFFGIMHKKNE